MKFTTFLTALLFSSAVFAGGNTVVQNANQDSSVFTGANGQVQTGKANEAEIVFNGPAPLLSDHPCYRERSFSFFGISMGSGFIDPNCDPTSKKKQWPEPPVKHTQIMTTNIPSMGVVVTATVPPQQPGECFYQSRYVNGLNIPYHQIDENCRPIIVESADKPLPPCKNHQTVINSSKSDKPIVLETKCIPRALRETVDVYNMDIKK